MLCDSSGIGLTAVKLGEVVAGIPAVVDSISAEGNREALFDEAPGGSSAKAEGGVRRGSVGL